jgi:hypothetical protein
MLYQLPNGRVIYLSTEEYLSLSDDDLHQLVHSGYGEEPSYGIYFGKSPKEKSKSPKQVDLDYKPESDETDTNGPIDINSFQEE